MSSIIRWFRVRKAVAKWNADRYLLRAMAERHADGVFYWGQLVFQEIHMYITLGKQVQQEEFNVLCRRRGFDAMMRAYLSAMLKHVGLGRLLPDDPSAGAVQPACAQEAPLNDRPPLIGNDGLPWPQTFDSQTWAKEFIRHVKGRPEIATDEATMIGWFANAIMVGYDRARQKSVSSGADKED
jgi:hypothetical protein